MKRFLGIIIGAVFALMPSLEAQATTLTWDFGFIPAGQAAVITQSTLTPPAASQGSLISGSGIQTGQSFSDTYFFTAPQAQSLIGGASIIVSGTLSGLQLFNGASLLATGLATLQGGYSISLANLSFATPYRLVVDGTAGSPFSGYTAAVAISNVPLPAALPLFGAGLAAMGLLARRRRAKAQACESPIATA